MTCRFSLLSRGRKHPRPFAELLIAEFPNQSLSLQQARQRLLGLPVRPWLGQPSPTFSDALDYYEAMVEKAARLAPCAYAKNTALAAQP